MKLPNFLILFSILLFASCIKDKPSPNVTQTVQLSGAKKVYIINEGNFMNGNASVSLFDTGNNSVVENYYYMQNTSALGDVAQSISKINNQYYIVVNNSNKIVVVDENFKYKRSITGLTSPRYIQQVSNKKAYVSDLYANAISIIDLSTGVKTGSIALNGWSEKMVMLYNKVYVTNMTKNYIYVIDAITDQLTDSISFGARSGSIVIDKNDKIWVASHSSTPIMTTYIAMIDPTSKSVEKLIEYSSSQIQGSICINKTLDTLFFFNGGISKMAITQNIVPPPFILKGNKNFYGLGVHPTTHDIYVSDAIDYVQKSNIYVYDVNTGIQKRSFKAGINATGFYFE